MAAGETPTFPEASAIPSVPHGRPRRINNRNFIASNSTSNPLGRELVCSYRPGRPGKHIAVTARNIPRCRMSEWCNTTFTCIFGHEVMQPGDNPPIGLLLCTDYSDTLVQYSTEGLSDIYVGKYMLHLPSTETIRQYLIDHMPNQSDDEKITNQ